MNSWTTATTLAPSPPMSDLFSLAYICSLTGRPFSGEKAIEKDRHPPS